MRHPTPLAPAPDRRTAHRDLDDPGLHQDALPAIGIDDVIDEGVLGFVDDRRHERRGVDVDDRAAEEVAARVDDVERDEHARRTDRNRGHDVRLETALLRQFCEHAATYYAPQRTTRSSVTGPFAMSVSTSSVDKASTAVVVQPVPRTTSQRCENPHVNTPSGSR